MQRSEPQLDLPVDDGVEVEDRDAVRIGAREVLILHRLLDLGPRVDGRVRIQLARDHQTRPVRRHVHAVRALGLRGEVEDPSLDRLVDRNDGAALNGDRVGGVGRHLGRALPVDEVHVVHVVLRRAGLERRISLHHPAGRHLRVEAVDEHPAKGGALARIGEILPVGRELHRERLVHVDAAGVAVEFEEGHRAPVLLLVVLQRSVASIEEPRVLGRLDDVLGVRRHERAAVVRDHELVDHDLLGLEVPKIDHGDARVRLVVDEEELAVVVAVGLGERRVVRVAPEDLLVVHLALGEHVHRLLGAEAPALPGLGGEHGDDLEEPHRGHPDHQDLPGVAARREQQVVVHLTGRHEGLQSRRDVGLAQATGLRDVSDIARRPCAAPFARDGEQQHRPGGCGRNSHSEQPA